MHIKTVQSVGLGLAGILLLCLLGCGKGTDRNARKEMPAAAKKPHDHSDWWCEEHGIPEDICGLCNRTYATECRRKDDWCKEHERPRSQCFLCEPALKETFTQQYRSRYGKEPPPIKE